MSRRIEAKIDNVHQSDGEEVGVRGAQKSVGIHEGRERKLHEVRFDTVAAGIEHFSLQRHGRREREENESERGAEVLAPR